MYCNASQKNIQISATFKSHNTFLNAPLPLKYAFDITLILMQIYILFLNFSATNQKEMSFIYLL